ncbi:MAG: hypothetical protein ABW250_04470 [Pyrinomonadaceae bacterium]
MGKLVIVRNDSVEGTDTHPVSGSGTAPNGATVAYAGAASFAYRGRVTQQLSDFVRVNGAPLAVKSSRSALNPGETAAGGGHAAASGGGFVPPSPTPIPNTLKIDAEIGEGRPSATAGSRFVSAGGSPVLLDGDPFDTCGPAAGAANSTVDAVTQNFISCSE